MNRRLNHMGKIEPLLSVRRWRKLHVQRFGSQYRQLYMRLLEFRLLTIAVDDVVCAKEPGSRIPNYRIEKVDYVHSAAYMLATSESRTDSYKPADCCQHGQHGQRHPHRGWRLVRNVRVVGRRFVIVIVHFVLRSVVVRSVEKFLLAPKSHSNQTRHVEGRAGGCDCSDNPYNPTYRNVPGSSCVPEDLVFGPETAKRNDAADGQPAGQERQVRVGHVLPEPAHASHVLLVVHSMNDAAGAEKHQRLEKGVGHYMEYSDRESSDSTGHEHETELRDGRIGQNFFDVVLGDTNRCGE